MSGSSPAGGRRRPSGRSRFDISVRTARGSQISADSLISGCRVRTLEGESDLLRLAAANPRRYPGLLASAAAGPHARYDILFAFPRDALTLDPDGRVRDGHGRDRGGSFIDALDAAWRAARAEAKESASASDRPTARVASSVEANFRTVTRIGGAASSIEQSEPRLPFRGGWLLFLTYELGAEIEPRLRECLPAAPDEAVPVALAVRCPAAIIVDRTDGRTHAIAETASEDLLDALCDDLAAAATTVAPGDAAVSIGLCDEDDAQSFLGGVASIHDHLLAGDVFQVNLSREWRVRLTAAVAPAVIFANLRRANPAPFAGLLQWQRFAIVSSSPERLINVRGDAITTRPVAGTRARLDGDGDAERLRELIAHPKERAEHVMLIDLERNDLGRVCVPGSVVVDELMALESYAHVHHIVSNVRGTLRAGVTPGSIIRAVFPGGTITGCPKVRTMEIIAAIERVGRGAYTGSLGYLNRDGDMDLNILIRSMTMAGELLRFRAGAGIVADSVAERELDETRAKARGLLRALGLDA